MAEKSTGQWIGSIIGAVVGFYTGGATWYATAASMASGAATGSAIGGLIDPPKGPQIFGPRLSDLSQQMSSYGAPIPRVYGSVALMGNVFWIENNSLKETSDTEGGGKGGGGSEVTTYSYSATFALGLCQGEIAGVRRIWISGKLIYDAGADDLQTILASNATSSGFRVHNGSATQMPDSRMQGALGVANTPAYRGLAYIVFDDLQLADYGNTLVGAQIKVEVVCNGAVDDRLVSSFAIPESPKWYFTAFKNAGNQFDSDGFSNFVVAQDSYPLWIQAFNGDIVKETILSGPSIYPISTAVMPLTTSLDTIQYAFVTSNDYFVWGKKGSVTTLQVPGATPMVFAENENVIYSTFLLSGSYYICKITNGIVSSQLNIGTKNPAVAVWGESTVTAFRLSVTDPVSIVVLEEVVIDGVKTIVQNDSYFVFDPSSYTISGTQNSIYVSDDTLYIVSGVSSTIGSSVTITIIDLISRSIIETKYIPQSFAAITVSERPNVRVLNNLLFYGQRNTSLANYGFVHNQWQFDRQSSSTATLSDVVSSECLLSELLSLSDINVESLTDAVRGYRISASGAIRGGLEPLQGAYPFDVIQSGYKIKFSRRTGLTSLATVTKSELGARPGSDDSAPSLVRTREMDTQIPAKVTVTHLDISREYDVGEQYAERLNSTSINEHRAELALVMSAAEAAQLAETLLYMYWLERQEFSFTLPPTYNMIEPGDVITVDNGTDAFDVRLTSMQYRSDGVIECSARPHRAIYISTALGADGALPAGTISLPGQTEMVLLDIPTLVDVLDVPGFAVACAGYFTIWPGCVVFRSTDAGMTWSDVLSFANPSIIGYTTGTLPAPADSRMIDKKSTLSVKLFGAGVLSSVTEGQMLNGANHFAYGANGRWEIISAQNAVLQGDGTYLLSDMMRGRFGTEWAMGTHQAYDRLVLLNTSTLQFVASPLSGIGLTYQYRAVTFGKQLSSAESVEFVYAGENLECLSPVYLNGSLHPTTNDWSLNWIRRTRVGGEWRSYVDASLGEASEAYEVEIYSSAAYTTIKRTITGLTSAACAYTSADQVTDFGSNQATLYVKIYQLSANVGRGQPLTTSITR